MVKGLPQHKPQQHLIYTAYQVFIELFVHKEVIIEVIMTQTLLVPTSGEYSTLYLLGFLLFNLVLNGLILIPHFLHLCLVLLHVRHTQ